MPYQYTHKLLNVGPAEVKLVAGAEAQVAGIEKGIDVGPTNGAVLLDAVAVVTTVAESTEIVVRIRRTSLTGAEVAKVTVKPGATAIVSIPIQGEDKPGEGANIIYILTIQDSAGKASESKKSTIEATW